MTEQKTDKNLAYEELYKQYNIIFTDDFTHYINDDTANSKSVIIVDSNVAALYNIGEIARDKKVITISASEEAKSIHTLYYIFDKLMEFSADRTTEIIAIGGGITCDIAAFAAATYLRGVPVRLIPTTLLAQCDAAIGGKNGINFNNVKNTIGTIRQANSIIIDLNFLRTLPREILADGFAEIIKIAAARDAELFAMLQNFNFQDIDFSAPELKEIIQRAVYNKLLIVRDDERESGIRRLLNFGHTLAHALESAYKISHGRAVAIGMNFAVRLSVHQFAAPLDLVNQIEEIIEKFDLKEDIIINPEELFKYMEKDKKKENDSIYFITLKQLGQAQSIKITYQLLKEELNALHNN